MAVRLGGIVAGVWDTVYIHSFGDGAHGVGTSLIVGKLGGAAGFSAEAGFRMRGRTEVDTAALGGADSAGPTADVPNDLFVDLGLFVPAGSRVTLGVDYCFVHGPLLTDVTATLHGKVLFGQVVAGRNTAASRVFGARVGFAFRGGGFDFRRRFPPGAAAGS